MEMLEKSEDGAFFVRDSQSRPGCHALTMRAPHEVNPNGFGNFLIIKAVDGLMLQVLMFHPVLACRVFSVSTL